MMAELSQQASRRMETWDWPFRWKPLGFRVWCLSNPSWLLLVTAIDQHYHTCITQSDDIKKLYKSFSMQIILKMFSGFLSLSMILLISWDSVICHDCILLFIEHDTRFLETTSYQWLNDKAILKKMFGIADLMSLDPGRRKEIYFFIFRTWS